MILSFAKQELPDLDKFLSVLNQEVVSTDPYQLDLHIVNGLSLTEILLHLAVNNDDIVDDYNLDQITLAMLQILSTQQTEDSMIH